MVQVRRSTIVDAPVEEVWRTLRDFNGHERWHPAIAVSAIEQGRGAAEVGAVRAFALRDGARLRERLLHLSDRDRTFTYCIVESPIPLLDYVATVRLKPVTDGRRTYWEWSSRFRAPPGQEGRLAALVAEDIYEAGFAALKARFGGAPSTSILRIVRAGDGAPPAAFPAPQPATAEAAVMTAYGGPEVLEWREVPLPPPGPGEVRLRHTAVGVNYIDVYCRSGYMTFVPPGGVPGLEAAGVIEDVGPNVDGLAPGDRVAYACPPAGAYATRRTMAADLLVPLPDDMDDVTAAALLLKGMTAEYLLHRVHAVKEGDVVLVHAAAGGVGQLLCQWASHLGATVIGTVGSMEKERIARRAGAAYVIRYRDEDFAARVQEITGGRGADVVYDAVGRDTFQKSYEALAVRGHLVSFGQASGDIGPVAIAAFAGKSATVSRPSFPDYAGTRAQVQAITANLFRAWERGIVDPGRITTLPLREVAEAHRRLEARATAGALVLLP